MRRRLARRAGRVGAFLLDLQEHLYGGGTPCRSYGGVQIYGQVADRRVKVRVCNKRRWHIDSHCYDIENA